jgi:hypothetical protein
MSKPLTESRGGRSGLAIQADPSIKLEVLEPRNRPFPELRTSVVWFFDPSSEEMSGPRIEA